MHYEVRCRFEHYKFNDMKFNNMRKYIFLSLFTLACVGCSTVKKETTIEQLTHETIDIPDAILGSIGSIQKVGDYLVVLDYSTESLFHLIKLSEQRYIGKFGTRGPGPNEFNHPTKLHPYGEEQLCCYEPNKREIKLLTINTTDERMITSTLFQMKDRTFFEAIPVNGDTILTTGCLEEGMFLLTTANGKQVSITNEGYPYEDEEEQKISNQLRAMVYQGNLSMSSGKKFAYAISSVNQLHFYEIKNGKIIKSGEAIKSYAKYKPDAHSQNSFSVFFDSNAPECYTDINVTDSLVYVLYSGRSFKEHKLTWKESKYLFIYNWKGTLLKSYQLDVPITHFCLDENGQTIYGIANIPDPTIVKFTIQGTALQPSDLQ